MRKDFIIKTSSGEIPVDYDDRTGITYLTIKDDDFEKIGMLVQDLISLGYGYKTIEINNIEPDVNGYVRDDLADALGITVDELDLIISGKCRVKFKEHGNVYILSTKAEGLFKDGSQYINCAMDWDLNRLEVCSVDFLVSPEDTYYMIKNGPKYFSPTS